MKREKIAILPSLYDFGGSMEPGKKWYVQFSVKDPRSGKMVRKKVYAGLQKIREKKARYKRADEIIQEYTELLRNGWNPLYDDQKAMYVDQLQYHHAASVYQDRKAGNLTFNYFANRYLNERLSGLDPNTVATYRSKFRVFHLWTLREGYADLDISAYTNKVVLLFFAYLNTERMSSAITYNKYRQLLKGLFDFVMDEGKVTINPVQRLPVCTRVNKKEPMPIVDQADFDKLMNRIKKDRELYLFVLFEYYCLMRPTEIRLMQVKWIDFARGVIHIPASVSKTKRPKTPIIPNEFMQVLRDNYSLHLAEKEHYVIGKGSNGTGDRHYGKNIMRWRFNKIRAELKMPKDYMLYSYKHTANIRLEAMSVPVYDRMMQNGHTSIVTTERYTRNKAGFTSRAIKEGFPSINEKSQIN